MTQQNSGEQKGDTFFYRFISLYQDYLGLHRDYGDGQQRSMVEMHVLAIICDEPGLTVGDVARAWGCTKGAASQNITKLEKKELLVRTKFLSNGREVHLYPTKLGQHVAELHKEYDKRTENAVGEKLMGSCTLEELVAFNKVLGAYCAVLEDELGLESK